MFAGGGGWALVDGRLMSTADGGAAWSDRTPASDPGLASQTALLCLRDGAHAWAVRTGGETGLLTWTADAGRSWQELPFPLDAAGAGSGAVRPAGVYFLDALHGWISLSAGSTGGGELISTSDAGASWTAVGPMPIAAPVVFSTASDGFAAGGAAQTDLYATHDGGATWARQSLPFPPIPQDSALTVFRVLPPLFVDSRHGLQPVAYADTHLVVAGVIFVLYATSDGGKTWSIATPVELRSPGAIDSATVTAADDRVWRFAVHNVLYSSNDAGHTWSPRPVQLASLDPLPRGDGDSAGYSLASPSFVSATAGWAVLDSDHCPAGGSGVVQPAHCVHAAAVIRTTDGGATWTRVRIRGH